MVRDGGGAEAIKDACQVIIDNLVTEEPLYPIGHNCIRVQVAFENIQATCCVSNLSRHTLKIDFFLVFPLVQNLDSYLAQDEKGRKAEMIIEF